MYCCQWKSKNNDECLKIFGSLSALVKHQKSHGNISSHNNIDRLFICLIDGCNAKFKERKHLNEHYNGKHLRKHKCNICLKTFNNKNYLSNHIKQIHGNEKKHSCLYCDLIFSHKSNLKRHMDSIHNNHQRIKYQCKVCLKQFTR